jgi:hypothetical protein
VRISIVSLWVVTPFSLLAGYERSQHVRHLESVHVEMTPRIVG